MLTDYQHSKYVNSGYNYVPKKLIEKSIAAEYRLFTEQDHSLSLSGRYTDNSQFENAFTARLAGAYRFSPNIKSHASLVKLSIIQQCPNTMVGMVISWQSKSESRKKSRRRIGVTL
ncbi:cira protein [Canicola haemoglobinophilus]|uniref:Cira protein n=1 Tax=Canicola haemoglobinophilus TaxID=733 RepID=A0AB38HEJ9_9PAST|nr:cira protein [Canicola haemoglobinophilus]